MRDREPDGGAGDDRRARAALAVAGGAWTVYGLTRLAERPVADGPVSVGGVALGGLAATLLGAALVVAAGRSRGPTVTPPPPPGPDHDRPSRLVRGGLLASALAAALLAGRLAATRGPDRGTWDVTATWLVGVGLLLGAAGVTPGVVARRARSAMSGARARLGAVRARPPAPSALAAAAILAYAATARLIALDRFPSVLDSDEGTLLLTARRAREGDLPNPFGASFYGNPDLYRAVQGVVSRLAPDGPAAYRLTSAAVGLVAVIATWRLGRRLLGDTAGLVAAAVLASSPLHLWASRSGLNNITDAASLSVGLLFLVRAQDRGRRRDAALAGVAFGAGLYGYFGATAFPFLALGVLAVGAVGPGRATTARRALRSAAWLTAGIVAAGAPRLGFALADPESATARYRIVSGGSPSLLDRASQVPAALFRPLIEQTEGFYRQPAPSAGRFVAPLVAIGLVAWAVGAVQHRRGPARPGPRPEPLLLTWLALSIAVSQTIEQPGQRMIGLTVLWALAAGSGAATVVAVVQALVAGRDRAVRGAVVAAVSVAALSAGARATFDEGAQLRNYGDLRTTGAYDLGWRLARSRPADVVVLAGGAFSYHGFGNARFLAPDADPRVLDLREVPTDADGRARAPDLPAGDLLVLPAEWDDATWCLVAAAHPEATRTDARDQRGTLLYTLFHRGAGAGLTRRATPAGTTLGPATDRACPPP